MSLTKTTGWKCSHLQALALVVALLSVFGWGLQYKLSLYKNSSHKHVATPAAKLLSPKERVVNATGRTPFLGDASTLLLLLATSGSVLLLPRPDGVVVARERFDGQLHRTPISPQIFCRPPPVSV